MPNAHDRRHGSNVRAVGRLRVAGEALRPIGTLVARTQKAREVPGFVGRAAGDQAAAISSAISQ